MTPNEARSKMMLRLLNSGVIAQDRIDFDNGESFNKPTSGAWMRMTIRFNGEVRVNLGGEGVQTKFTEYGIATVQVFTTLNEGEYTNDELARQVRDLFRKKRDDGLYYGGVPAGGEVRINTIGRDGAWYGSNVVVPFWFESCAS